MGNGPDLLSHGADGNDGGPGYGGIVKPHDPVFLRKAAVFAYEQI
jgi:hypothetical protein